MLRDFTTNDQAAVRDLILAGLQERWGFAYDEAFNLDLDDIDANYVRQGAQVVVIEQHRSIVATGTLLLPTAHSAQIVRMSVDRARRRQGLGRQVVEELLARAAKHGVREVNVFTDTPWASAVALYASCGFVETSSDETDTYFSLVL